MISQWYDPEMGSAAIPGVIARSLTDLGHEVSVVTGFPNYPTGKVYPGYRVRPYQHETRKNVSVHRAPMYASHDAHGGRRATNFLSFAAGASAVAVAKLSSVDAVLVYSSPATAAIPAMALRALRRRPFVVHIQDLWPESVLSSSLLGEEWANRVSALLHRFCDAVYRHASAVAVTSPGMADLIASRGVRETKISVIPNWADESSFRPVPANRRLRSELGLDRRFTVMYAGNFGEYQALDVMIEAAASLRDRADIQFALVGGGVTEDDLRRSVARNRLDNVLFIPPQPFDRMADLLALGDVQVISLQDRPLFHTTLPSKLQATLSAGRPVIAALVGDAADIVEASGAGIIVKPGSASALADAVRTLADQPSESVAALGRTGRTYYLDHFSKQVISGRLGALLEGAAAGRSAARG